MDNEIFACAKVRFDFVKLDFALSEVRLLALQAVFDFAQYDALKAKYALKMALGLHKKT